MNQTRVQSVIDLSDSSATRSAYSHFNPSPCDCAYCRNFTSQPDLIPPSVASLLRCMGIDPAKPHEIIDFGASSSQGRIYQVEWPFLAPPGVLVLASDAGGLDGCAISVYPNGVPCPAFDALPHRCSISVLFRDVPWKLNEPPDSPAPVRPVEPPHDSVTLRPVIVEDLPALYAHQADPLANQMAGTKPRSEEAFREVWARIFADPTIVPRAIIRGGELVGGISVFKADGHDSVGYCIDRQHWGKGIATQALHLLLREVARRPLHATVLRENVASLRILEKCGFRLTGFSHEPETDRFLAAEVAHWVLE